MQKSQDDIINLATFSPTGALGEMFVQAKTLNRLNDVLENILPEHLKKLSLCKIENNIATFVAKDQAIAFRAQKQHKELLDAIKTLEVLSKIQKVMIKTDVPECWHN